MITRSRNGRNGSVKLTFSLPLSEPDGVVSVVGDFNEWTPGQHQLVRRTNGKRSVSVVVPTGTTLCFRYLATGGQWFDDESADAYDYRGSLVTA